VLDLQTNATKLLVRGGSNPRYARTGHLLYVARGIVQAMPFDVRRLEVSGTPAPVLEDVATTRVGAALVAIAANGALVYIPGVGGARRNIMLLDDRGRASPLPGVPPDVYRQLRVSPDGKRLAFSLSRDIWIYDFARGVMTPLTTDPGGDTNPLWTPDGQRVVFTSTRAGYSELFWRAADGSGSDQKLLTRGTDLTSLFATGWSKDGEQLIFTEVPIDIRRTSIGQLAIKQPSDLKMLLSGETATGRASISPDGHWIAYESNASGRYEIHVERYPELGGRQRISLSGGRDPRWSRDGRTLFFGTENGRQLFAVDITPGSVLTAGQPRVLLEDAMDPIVVGEQSYDVAPDGRFLVIRSEAAGIEGTAPPIVLVQNWFEELKQLVPTD
jgi:serine/threonine-protein kinase